MSVIYAPNGGGSNQLGILGTLLSFVPGMQPIGMWLGALGSAIKGDTAGTVMNLAGMGKKTAPQAPQPPAFQPNW